MNTKDANPPQPWWLDLIETAVGSLVKLDPEAMDRVAAMAGKVIAIELSGLALTVYCVPHQQGIHLLSVHDGDVHVRIRGTPLALLAMGGAPDPREATFSGDVEIIGDLALGRYLQSLLKSLSIDWEELLSSYTGDIVAHQIGNACRSVSTWLAQTRETLELNAAEYIRAEIDLVPERGDVREFLDAVDVLHADTDRLEARLRRLGRQVAGPA